MFTVERNMLRRENREMKQVWDEVRDGGYEACFDGIHECLVGDANPYMGKKVFHWRCLIKHNTFTMPEPAIPLKGVASHFAENIVKYPPSESVA